MSIYSTNILSVGLTVRLQKAKELRYLWMLSSLFYLYLCFLIRLIHAECKPGIVFKKIALKTLTYHRFNLYFCTGLGLIYKFFSVWGQKNKVGDKIKISAFLGGKLLSTLALCILWPDWPTRRRTGTSSCTLPHGLQWIWLWTHV